MRSAGLSGQLPRRRGRTTIRVQGVRTAPDLVKRDFNPTEINRLWCADIAEVKALACELPATSGRPISRWSATEIASEAVQLAIVCEISGTTVWRWLSEDAIRPWAWRSWVFPRDPEFAAKAGRVLDL